MSHYGVNEYLPGAAKSSYKHLQLNETKTECVYYLVSQHNSENDHHWFLSFGLHTWIGESAQCCFFIKSVPVAGAPEVNKITGLPGTAFAYSVTWHDLLSMCLVGLA